MKTYLGTKFYKYEDESDNPTIYKIIRFQNTEIVVIRNEETMETFKVTLDTLKNSYVKLAIDGLILFCCVTISGDKNDVIVSLIRQKEIQESNGIPYCVCRQGITDIHAQQYTISTGKNVYGACVSTDTVPEGISFDIMIACDEMHQSSLQSVAIYKNTTLDDILDMIDTREYDNTLNIMFLNHLQHVSKTYGNMFYKAKLKSGECEGYCNTLRKLLELNDFMYDFHRGFDIYPLDFDLSGSDQQALSIEYMEILSTLLCKNIDKALVIKYGHDISLSDIMKDYVLVSDVHNELYVIVYTFSGIYEIPVDQIESPENIITMNERMKSKSIKAAYERIRHNTQKFQV